MKNDGAWLEQLVKKIESNLLPPGFNVEARTLVMSEGVCIAELDIIITGYVGSSKYAGLIECRDRPSAGPAPVSWIEQLIARRERLKLSQVVAVSTTGFSQAALKAAEWGGIQLREVKTLDISEVDPWVAGVKVELEDYDLDFDIVHMELADDRRIGMPAIDMSANFENDDLYCFCSELGLLGSVYSIFQKGLSSANFDEADIHTPAQLRRWKGTFDHEFGSFFIGHGTNVVEIKSITFDIKMRKIMKEVKFDNFRIYEDRVESKPITWVASGDLTINAQPITVEMHVDGRSGDVTWCELLTG